MKKLFYTLVVASVCVVARAADNSADIKALQGTWLPKEAEMGGQAISPDLLKTTTLKFEKNEWEVIVGESPDKGTWTIDSSTKPKSMTVVGVKGPNAGKTFPCIYEIKGDTLRICYDLSGAKRPADFKTTAGTKLYLVSYTRKK